MSRLFGVGLFVIDSILDMFWALCRVLYLCSVYINKKNSDNHWLSEVFYSVDPAGARTQDPNIKSVVLYLLSY